MKKENVTAARWPSYCTERSGILQNVHTAIAVTFLSCKIVEMVLCMLNPFYSCLLASAVFFVF